MTPDDDGRWLREQLDSELDVLRSHPSSLVRVLDRAHEVPWWRRTAAGVPAWFAAAVAVLVVALVVPVAATGVLGGRGEPPVRTAAAPLTEVPLTRSVPTTPPAVPSPAVTTAPTPAPTRKAVPPARPSTARPSTTAPSAPATPATCGGARSASPTGAPGLAVDLDGDGAADELVASGSSVLARLAKGGEVVAVTTTAGPYVSVLPVETDGSPGREILVVTRGAIGTDGSVGQTAALYDLRGCSLEAVPNAQGRPYVFEVGASQDGARLSGVACEGSTLLGVTSTRDPVTQEWQVRRTPVSSAGGRAVNGTPAESVLAADDPLVPSLREASCFGATPQELP